MPSRDGKIMHKNLQNIGKNEEWLQKQLKSKKKELKDILLATVDINEKLVLYTDSKEYRNKDLLE